MAENKCDELFGKSGELVEFRKKQVLEGALEIVQRNYKEIPNKMEVIAKLFGKKLGEEFKIKDLSTGIIHISSFNNYGMRTYVAGFPNSWKQSWDMVMRLIIGNVVIINE